MVWPERVLVRRNLDRQPRSPVRRALAQNLLLQAMPREGRIVNQVSSPRSRTMLPLSFFLMK